MLPVRLVIEKVPAHVAAEKRRKLKNDKQNKRKNLSEGRLAFCDANAFVTNTDEGQIPAHKIRAYYGLRWQIEITFKAWKSVYGFGRARNVKIQRFECVHYASLLLILLTTRLMSFCRASVYARDKIELSELKFFKLMKHQLPQLRAATQSGHLHAFIDRLLLLARKVAIKHRRRRKPRLSHNMRRPLFIFSL